MKYKQGKKAMEFNKNKELQKEYNDEIARKTWHYQKEFGFEVNKNYAGHEFWNNEADAFKHAFSSADLYFKYGDLSGLFGGIIHEWYTNKNPQGEWNMDSWNNNQGREIAREIEKEYGKKFLQLSEQQRDDIIAKKVIERMRNGELITYPDDKRKYFGATENLINFIKKIDEAKIPFTPTRSLGGVQNNGKSLGFAASIDNSGNFNLADYINPLTGNNRIYTREDIASMSQEEFIKHEKEIDAQMEAFKGKMPSNSDLEREAKTSGDVIYVNSYTRADGVEVRGYYRSRPTR